MQEILRTIYESLHIRELLKNSHNFANQLSSQSKLCIIGLGKVAYHHVQALSELSNNVISKIAVVPENFSQVQDVTLIRGGHPELESKSFEAGRTLMQALKQIPNEATMIFGLSGGGSALAEIPAPGFDEAFLQMVNSSLLKSGAPIVEMNLLRMALSALKNGGVLCGFNGKPEVYLSVLSDIPTPDWLSVASSPLIYRELDVKRIKEVAERWLPKELSVKIKNFLASRDYQQLQDEKMGTAQKFKVSCELVADGDVALAKTASLLPGRSIKNLGVLSCSFEEVVEMHLGCLKKMPRGPFALISGGECPVTIPTRNSGRGGRNTHFTLALAEQIFYKNLLGLSPQELESYWVASLATDGRDGNCDCAGACFNKEMMMKTSPRSFFEKFDSYSFFPQNALLNFNQYQSNLMDVRIICGVKS